MNEITTDTSQQRADEFTEPSGGPEPTPAEEAAAERAASQVDTDAVEPHYADMTEKGRKVRGEGDVFPSDDDH